MTPVNAPPARTFASNGIVDGDETTSSIAPHGGISDETAATAGQKRVVKVAKIVDIGFGGMLTTSATGGFKPITLGGKNTAVPFSQQQSFPQQFQKQTPPPEKETVPEHVEPAAQKHIAPPPPTSLGGQRKKTFTISKFKTPAPSTQQTSAQHMGATQVEQRTAATIPQQQRTAPPAAAVQPQRDNSQAPRETLPKPRVSGSTSLKFLPKGALKVAQNHIAQTHTAINHAQIPPPPANMQPQNQSQFQTQRQMPRQHVKQDENFANQVRIEAERQEAILREAYRIAGEKIRKEEEKDVQTRKHAAEEAERAAKEAADRLAAQIAKERAETEELLRKERETLELRKKELLEMKKKAEEETAKEAERAAKEAADRLAAQIAKERAETEELLRKERETLELHKKELLEMKKKAEEETAKAKQIQENKITGEKTEKTENGVKSSESPELPPTDTKKESDKEKAETDQPVLKKDEPGKKDSKPEEITEVKKDDANAKKSPVKGLPPPSPFNKKGLRPPPFPAKAAAGKSVAGKDDLKKEETSSPDIVTTEKDKTKIGINANLKTEGVTEAKKDDANAKKSPVKGLPPPSPFNKKGLKPPPFPAKAAAGKSVAGKDGKEDSEKEKSPDIVKTPEKDRTQTKVGINTTVAITNSTLVKIQNKKKTIIFFMVGAAVTVACLLIIFIGGKMLKMVRSSFSSSPVADAPPTATQNKLPSGVQGGIKTGSMEMEYKAIYQKIKKAPPATSRQEIDAIIGQWQDFIDSHPDATDADKCIKDAKTIIKNLRDMKELYDK
ncbi:MAG: hypothetical protein WCS96_03845 [Victivallales bacterium]